jgi:hypothetical protein
MAPSAQSLNAMPFMNTAKSHGDASMADDSHTQVVGGDQHSRLFGTHVGWPLGS